MKYEIRELSIGGILDQSIQVIMNNFGVLMAIAFSLQLPLAIATLVIMTAFGFNPGGDPAAMQAVNPMFFIGLAVIGLLTIIVTPITNAAMVHAIADAYLGKKPSVGASFSRALTKIGPLIWTWIIVGLAIMGGLIACIIPGILCIIWFSLATQVVVLEPVSGIAAMKRSKELIKGNIGKWFVLMILLAVIGMGIGFGSQMIGGLTQNIMIAQLIQSVSQIVAGLLGAAILVLLYFSARCMHEDFDLELLAASFGESRETDGEFDAFDDDQEDF